jgi:hypothetical protein
MSLVIRPASTYSCGAVWNGDGHDRAYRLVELHMQHPDLSAGRIVLMLAIRLIEHKFGQINFDSEFLK